MCGMYIWRRWFRWVEGGRGFVKNDDAMCIAGGRMCDVDALCIIIIYSLPLKIMYHCYMLK